MTWWMFVLIVAGYVVMSALFAAIGYNICQQDALFSAFVGALWPAALILMIIGVSLCFTIKFGLLIGKTLGKKLDDIFN